MKNKNFLYAVLAVLFVVAATVQLRHTIAVVSNNLSPKESARMPFALDEQLIGDVKTEAAQSGIQKGDRVIAINGKPYNGLTVLYDELGAARPGDTTSLTIRHEKPQPGQSVEETVNVKLIKVRPENNLNDIVALLVTFVLSVFMPNFCLLLGFWVAFVRVRDPLAWILLGLLLAFQSIGLQNSAGATGFWLTLHHVYQNTFISTLGLWFLLFGIYFPERWTLDKKLPWLKWLFIVSAVFKAIAVAVAAYGRMRNFELNEAVRNITRPVEVPLFILSVASIGVFFAAIGHKGGTATDMDAKRRLKFLLTGAYLSLTPMFIIIIIGLIRGRMDFFNVVPGWVVLTAVLTMGLFPITLAYLIVVHRAMDVRVVIRQGLQYALAKNGVRVIQILLSIGVMFAAVLMATHPDSSRLMQFGVIGVGVALIFLLQKFSGNLKQWIDKKFFREAYNTDQILSDLSENVRTIVETEPLLQTVAQRVSESLHVSKVALVLKNGNSYQPAHALGYAATPVVSFNEKMATVERLKRNEPIEVFCEDPDCWINTTPNLDGERTLLSQLDSQLLLPMGVKEKLTGFISLGPKLSEEPYSPTDLRLLKSVAAQTGLALENSQLAAAIAHEMAQRERLNREIEIAREVQERLFPQCFPNVEGLDFCGSCRPALGVGGDYYDFLMLPNKHLGVAIGDVSGKGISAALLMASLQASLRGQAIQGTNDLASLMGNVNKLVYDASAENRYATFFYAQYEPETRSLTYVNAGHNPPMIFRKDNDEIKILRLETGGPVVGLLPMFPYSQETVTLQSGDLLIGFTDGISEAMNNAEEEWGEERMIEAIKEHYKGCSSSRMLDHLVARADEFAAGAKQHDDMTLVVVRII